MGQEALKQGLLKKIEERGKQNIYKIRISGKRDPETKVDPSLFPKELRIVECLDETLPQYDFYALYKEHQQDILGFFIRSYLKKDLEDLSPMEKQSLFYGVFRPSGRRKVMILEKLYIDGFGKFSDYSLNFSPSIQNFVRRK